MKTIFVLVVLMKLTASLVAAQVTPPGLVNVIIIGGTGDLAQKYLWQGFFKLFQELNDDSVVFHFYGSSRGPFSEENPKLLTILNNRLNCPATDDTSCMEQKAKFINQTSYFQLKTGDDYKLLGEKLHTVSQNLSTKEIGRVFYLSLPPRAYLSVSNLINLHCRPNNTDTWMKLVLEKPFGNDKNTAENMTKSLVVEFSEDEIYRVDHYLGKSVVKNILPLRNLNRENLDELLNKDHVDRVEISMLETVGVKGRVDFYDQYGVICDVMQNHIMEMLTLVAMDLPNNITDTDETKERKLQLIKQINRIRGRSLLVGQYADYQKDGIEDSGRLNFTSNTPTFAAAVLSVKNPRWSGVPFILVSGKKLKERVSYVRIVFKDNVHNTGNFAPFVKGGSSLKQLVFHVEHGSKSSPSIFSSKLLGALSLPNGLKYQKEELAERKIIYEEPSDELFTYVVKDQTDAYTSVIADIVKGRHENFVGSKHLLALWDIWSDVLESDESERPRLYDSSNDYSRLKFTVMADNTITFSDQTHHGINEPDSAYKPSPEQKYGVRYGMKAYRSLASVRTFDNVIPILASDILSVVKRVIKKRHVAHVAFSGGKSPEKLFQFLAQIGSEFPWERTHIWLVDERCVPLNDEGSNFNSLFDNLLKFIQIPYTNIHPIPVEVAGRLCEEQDRGDNLYEDTIKHHLKDDPFDVVILGLGVDGHTASLFPGQTTLQEKNRMVLTTSLPHSTQTLGSNSSKRITLSFKAINSAKCIKVLVMGKHKHQILDDIQADGVTVDKYPILGVQPSEGNITWYIDADAFHG